MAAHIEQDSELFVNYVSAQAIPADKRFVAFSDENGAPALLSLSSDGQLNLFRQKDGKLHNHPYNELCGIHDPIVAFSATQCSDKAICLAVAAKTSTGCQLVTLPMIQISNIDKPVMERSRVARSEANLPDIENIILGDFSKEHDVPVSIISYRSVGRRLKSDCALMVVEEKNGSLMSILSKKWNLPVDTNSIVDLALARTTLGDGIFALYEANGDKSIVLSTYDGSDFNVTVSCPQDTTSITTFLPAESSSHLMIGSGEIHHFTEKEYLQRRSPVSVLTSPLLKSGVKDLHAAVDGKGFSVWFTTNDNAAGYISSPTEATGTMTVTPLLPAGKGGRLSPMITSVTHSETKGKVNTIISVDESQNLMSLQQDGPNGSWDSYPLMVHASTNNYKVPSYTTRLRVLSGGNRIVPHASFKLQSSGRVSAIINGFGTYLNGSADGQIVQCDASGEVTFIVAVMDVSSHTFTLKEFKDGDGNDIAGLVQHEENINPSGKVLQKLSSITDGYSLRSALTRSGEKVFSVDGISDTDIELIGRHIGKIAAHGKTVPGSVVNSNGSTRVTNLMTGSQGGRALSELWNWVTEEAHSADTWVLNEIHDALELVIHFAQDTYHFILDNIKSVGKALTWLFEKLKTGFKKLLDYLAFVFNWDDIVTLKSSLSLTLTSGLLWSGDQVENAAHAVAQYFEGLKANLSGDVSTLHDEQSDLSPKPEHKTAQASMGFNFSKYHLVHGGVLEAFIPTVEPESIELLRNAWNTISVTVSAAEQDVMKIALDIKNSFKHMDQSVSAAEVAKRIMKGVAATFIDIIKGVAATIFGIVRDILKWVAANGNKSVEIPIFSALYRDISGDHSLTMFDAVCLIIAIPAQILGKLMMGAAVPDITGFMSKETFAAYIDGKASKQQAAAINKVFMFGFLGAEVIGIAVQMITLVSGDTVMSMAVSSRLSKSKHALALDLGGTALVNKPTFKFTDIKALSWLGLVTSGVNVLLGVPVYAGSDSDRKIVDRFRWGISVFRLAFTAVPLIAKLELGKETKTAINVGQAVAQTVAAALYVAVRISDSKAFPNRRDAVVSTHWINTLSKAGASLARDSDPEVAAVCEIIFGVSALGQIGVQGWSIYAAVQKGSLWSSDGDAT